MRGGKYNAEMEIRRSSVVKVVITNLQIFANITATTICGK